MPPLKTKPKKAAPAAKAAPAKQKKAPQTQESGDDDDDDDDDDIDEDEVDDEVSIGSADEEDDLDGEAGSEDDDDDDDDKDDEDDDDDDDDDEDERPAKKAKMNGKEAEKAAKPEKQDTKKAKKDAKTDAKAAKAAKPTEEKFEDRAAAVGPLTEDERKVFAANFRAMSATSIFVGKLPSDATDEDLKKLHPSIRSIRRPVSRKGAPATFGFLNFANKETADRALKEIQKKGAVKIRGQEVLVSENGNGQCHPPSTVDRRKLRIYGCPKFVTKDQVKKILPGCVDVLLGDKDKGNAIEAVAVFRTSADAKKVLVSQPTLTLNESVCALFYLNISHNVKQHERKKDRKQAAKQKAAEGGKTKKAAAAGSESDDQDDGELPADQIVKFKKENVKPQVQSAKKLGKKRPEPQDSDDEGNADDDAAAAAVSENKTPKGRKVALKSPQKTPVSQIKAGAKKTPARKGTPFKKAKA